MSMRNMFIIQHPAFGQLDILDKSRLFPEILSESK